MTLGYDCAEHLGVGDVEKSLEKDGFSNVLAGGTRRTTSD
jgi:hypothetical protein